MFIQEQGLAQLIYLAGILYKVGKEEESDEVEDRVLSVTSREHGNGSKMADFLFEFGRFYKQIGRWDRAKTILARAKEEYEVDAFTFRDEITKCDEELSRIEVMEMI